jgi:hypothetical protein
VRGGAHIVLEGLGLEGVKSVKVRRLTAPDALVRVEDGKLPQFAGRSFQDRTCRIVGEERYETIALERGRVSISLKDSEAVLIDIYE